MSRKISAAVAAAAEKFEQPRASEDQLAKIRAKASEARDLEREIADLEEKLKTKRGDLNKIVSSELPDLMQEAGVDTLGLPPKGNLPAYDVELKPFYGANIAAAWEEEKKREAFSYLTSLKAGDLIKTTVKIAFNREDRKKAIAFIKELKKKKIPAEVSEAVSSQTLTAWLKEQVERHSFTPDLAKIGGSVGKVAKLKARKQ